jgi:hypothetical protein
MLYKLLGKEEALVATVTAKFSSLPYSSTRPFFENTIIIQCINNIIKLCINNNTVINNNYVKLQDLVLLFKIDINTRQNFFEI